jgi:hypothetical protein
VREREEPGLRVEVERARWGEGEGWRWTRTKFEERVGYRRVVGAEEGGEGQASGAAADDCNTGNGDREV